ncbi:very short patch repair endonuclease [Jatrophihabitans sp.]|uniref:very short patch repair endonuclease n=1 Tax=Jatrophihabitans sp. TaxID=1932789 RepID=UPI002D1E2E45|nr:very short patch repair endonuclease [Jatrophihabitans sp.]
MPERRSVKPPLPASEAVSARLSRQRQRNTRPELALRSALHRQGQRFYVHRRPIPSLRRVADIVFPAVKVAVEVRGCFWHACPEHGTAPKSNAEWWADKLASNRRRDETADTALRAAGWLPVTVWEHESPEEAARRVAAVVQQRRAEGYSKRR